MLSASGRKVVLLLLLAVLVSPLAWAADGQPSKPVPVSSPDLLDRLWSFLTSLWAESGCRIDPNGDCIEPRPTNDTDEGCHIDPDGRCGS